MSGYKEITSIDFEDHLAALKKPFLNGHGVNVVRLNEPSKSYINGLLSELIVNNEIFFKKLRSAEITVISSESPLHFSLHVTTLQHNI